MGGNFSSYLLLFLYLACTVLSVDDWFQARISISETQYISISVYEMASKFPINDTHSNDEEDLIELHGERHLGTESAAASPIH